MAGSNEMRKMSMSVIDAEENRLTGAEQFFDAWDQDKNGTIDRKEFVGLFDMMRRHVSDEHARERSQEAKLERSKKRTKAWACFGFVAVSLLALSIAGNAFAAFIIVDGNVKTSAQSSGVMNVKGTDKIAKTAEATTIAPLIVAPLLPSEMLDRLKSVRLTRDDPMNNAIIKEQYTLVGHTWRNSTSMTLHTVRGDTIEIVNGNADLVISGTRYPVCEADVTCSALKITDAELDVDALMAKLPSSRRQLWGCRWWRRTM